MTLGLTNGVGLIKSIFKSNPAPVIKTLLFLILAVTLMLLDHRSASFHRAREKAEVLVWPIRILVDAPIRLVHWVSTGVSSKQHLLQENATLRAHQLLLEAKLQKLLSLERENLQLKALLQTASTLPAKVEVGQLLAVSMDPALQQIIVNKGQHDHVYIGQPVIDEYGVLGQVIAVGEFTSKVLLLTDKRFAIPVQDAKNGVRGIAVGAGDEGELRLIHFPQADNIHVGDLLVTSGLGMRFPVGYPVGRVIAKPKILGDRFVTLLIQPSSHFNRTRQVLLVTPNQVKLAAAVRQQLAAPMPNTKR